MSFLGFMNRAESFLATGICTCVIGGYFEPSTKVGAVACIAAAILSTKVIFKAVDLVGKYWCKASPLKHVVDRKIEDLRHHIMCLENRQNLLTPADLNWVGNELRNLIATLRGTMSIRQTEAAELLVNRLRILTETSEIIKGLPEAVQQRELAWIRALNIGEFARPLLAGNGINP